jgi:hypothetical protein
LQSSLETYVPAGYPWIATDWEENETSGDTRRIELRITDGDTTVVPNHQALITEIHESRPNSAVLSYGLPRINTLSVDFRPNAAVIASAIAGNDAVSPVVYPSLAIKWSEQYERLRQCVQFAHDLGLKCIPHVRDLNEAGSPSTTDFARVMQQLAIAGVDAVIYWSDDHLTLSDAAANAKSLEYAGIALEELRRVGRNQRVRSPQFNDRLLSSWIPIQWLNPRDGDSIDIDRFADFRYEIVSVKAKTSGFGSLVRFNVSVNGTPLTFQPASPNANVNTAGAMRAFEGDVATYAADTGQEIDRGDRVTLDFTTDTVVPTTGHTFIAKITMRRRRDMP